MFHHHPSSSSYLDPSTTRSSCGGFFFDDDGAFLAYYSPPYLPTSTTTSSSSTQYTYYQPQPSGFYDIPSSPDFGTGDLMEASLEHCSNPSGKVGRYSAEERKERIERYRSKRNLRNFHKKITYECRKTLANSRPRVRGRFVRNGETNQAENAEIRYYDGTWQQIKVVDGGGFYNDQDDDNLIASFVDGCLLHEPSLLAS